MIVYQSGHTCNQRGRWNARSGEGSGRSERSRNRRDSICFLIVSRSCFICLIKLLSVSLIEHVSIVPIFLAILLLLLTEQSRNKEKVINVFTIDCYLPEKVRQTFACLFVRNYGVKERRKSRETQLEEHLFSGTLKLMTEKLQFGVRSINLLLLSQMKLLLPSSTICICYPTCKSTTFSFLMLSDSQVCFLPFLFLLSSSFVILEKNCSRRKRFIKHEVAFT